jgi:hypothetical protein
MVTCNECGASNRSDAQFCAQCDAYLAWVEPSSQKAEQAPPDVDTDPVRADSAVRKPQTRPSRPVTASSRRPAQEQPTEQRQATRRDVAPPADDGSADAGLGAVRPAEPKQRIKKQYAPEQPRRRPGVEDVRSAAYSAGSVARTAGVRTPSARTALGVPGGVPLPATSLRGSLDDVRVARGFGRQMRAAAGGRRVRYDRGLATRVILVRTILATIAVLALVVLVSPLRTTVRSWGDRQLDRIIPGRFQDIPVASVTVAPPAGEEVRGFLTSYAVDGQPGRAWAIPTNAVPGANNAGQPCSAMANQPALEARFDQPTRLDRITIQAGLNPESPDRLKQARPRVVDLLLSTGECLRQEELPDSFEPFNLATPGGEVETVKMQIIDVYPPASGAGELVAVSEITFSQR